MPSRTRRSAKRFTRNKREYLWSSIAFENVSAAVAPGTNSALVLPSDWVRNTGSTTFQKGCVLQRIRGWLEVGINGRAVTDGAGVGAESVYGLIWKSEVDEDFAADDWSGSNSYNSEDLLWTEGAFFPSSANLPAAGVQLVQPMRSKWYIDVPTKRKLTSDDQIVFTVQSGAASPIAQYSGVVRALLTLP